GWLQIAAREVGARGFVLGIDLEPIPRVLGPIETWVADALAPGLVERLHSEGHAPYDAVLSDLAPRTSGIREADEARSLELAEGARRHRDPCSAKGCCEGRLVGSGRGWRRAVRSAPVPSGRRARRRASQSDARRRKGSVGLCKLDSKSTKVLRTPQCFECTV